MEASHQLTHDRVRRPTFTPFSYLDPKSLEPCLRVRSDPYILELIYPILLYSGRMVCRRSYFTLLLPLSQSIWHSTKRLPVRIRDINLDLCTAKVVMEEGKKDQVTTRVHLELYIVGVILDEARCFNPNSLEWPEFDSNLTTSSR